MKYTHEQQTLALVKAAKRMDLDAHIVHLERKRDLYTWADKIAGFWYRKMMPIKRSYMMCSTLDMDFFFTEDGIAFYTYAGYGDGRDTTEENIVEAFRNANKMRELMKEEIEKL